MKISIIGLGLIGSSMALDLRKSKFGKLFMGVDTNKKHQKEALELKIVDIIISLEEACKVSDLIILATPVNVSVALIPLILNSISTKTIVTDVGSTKTNIIEVVSNHPNRKQFIASHPMSGTEKSGPTVAFEGLFNNKIAIICNKEESDKKRVLLIKKMYKNMGASVIYMSATSHDEHVGYVSHLSHIISFALAVAVLEKEKSTENILQVAAGGFTSTVRLAKSSAEMWTPIFEQNTNNILPIIEVYIDKLNEIKSYIEQKDGDKITNFITEANKIKKIL